MKMELRLEGKVFVIEAEGAVSVRILEESGPEWVREGAARPAPSADDGLFTRLLDLRRELAEAPEEGPQAADWAGLCDAPEDAPCADDTLFARLAGLRRELAYAANVPPYVVFHDKALREMAEKRPQDLEAFSRISGVGKARLEKYGGIFLTAINEGVAA